MGGVMGGWKCEKLGKLGLECCSDRRAGLGCATRPAARGGANNGWRLAPTLVRLVEDRLGLTCEDRYSNGMADTRRGGLRARAMAAEIPG